MKTLEKRYEGATGTFHVNSGKQLSSSSGINVRILVPDGELPRCAEIFSDDQREYAEIGLEWEDGTLTGYDGCAELPEHICLVLMEEGYKVDDGLLPDHMQKAVKAFDDGTGACPAWWDRSGRNSIYDPKPPARPNIIKITAGEVQQTFDASGACIHQEFIPRSHKHPQFIEDNCSGQPADEELTGDLEHPFAMEQPGRARRSPVSELLRDIAIEFPGLKDGETEVSGAELVQYMTELVSLSNL